MATTIIIGSREYALDSFLSRARTIITIGRMTDEAHNVIAVDDDTVDVFQCQFTKGDDGWLVRLGQWRTECPKGIRPDRQHACSMCRGCCVNVRTANPTYSWRIPSVPLFVNGSPLSNDGIVLHDGDVLECGNTRMEVRERAE